MWMQRDKDLTWRFVALDGKFTGPKLKGVVSVSVFCRQRCLHSTSDQELFRHARAMMDMKLE